MSISPRAPGQLSPRFSVVLPVQQVREVANTGDNYDTIEVQTKQLNVVKNVDDGLSTPKDDDMNMKEALNDNTHADIEHD